MNEILFGAALGWMTSLFGLSLAMLPRVRSALGRILVLDTMTTILLAVLVLFTMRIRTSYYQDTALVLALLSFVATLAAARYFSEGSPFS